MSTATNNKQWKPIQPLRASHSQTKSIFIDIDIEIEKDGIRNRNRNRTMIGLT